jgi:hypothetical protein
MSAAADRPGFWQSALSDGPIIRAAFYAMLAGTLTVLYLDYRELSAADATTLATPLEPVLPAFDPRGPAMVPGPSVTTDYDVLRQPLSVELVAQGVLKLTGTFDPGSSDRFASEIGARGEYVTTVVLDSPGGSVTDAMAIGTLIAEKGYATRIESGGLCASSCPLAFAGGRERQATIDSAIGIHQVYAAAQADALPTAALAAGNAMSEAQKTTATISRHLAAMDVDPAVWLHALETPPDRLYYLSPDELVRYRLVTDIDEHDPAGDSRSRP